MGKCLIFCAGGFEGLIEPAEGSYIIAADGGLTYVNQLGLTPNAVIGDFDSLDYIPTSTVVRRNIQRQTGIPGC